MNFDIDGLMEDIFNLGYSIKYKVSILKKLEDNLKDSYKTKYISLLSDFFYEANQFSDSQYNDFDYTDGEDLEYLLDSFEKFIISYSKIIQYFDFANLEYPSELWTDFNSWKNKRLDLLENLKQL